MDASIEDAAAQDGGGKSTRTLSDAEIASHSLTFMLAGYETTANTLSYTAYLLALNPEIQEKLQNEIESYYQDNPVCMHACMHACMIGCFHKYNYTCCFNVPGNYRYRVSGYGPTGISQTLPSSTNVSCCVHCLTQYANS